MYFCCQHSIKNWPSAFKEDENSQDGSSSSVPTRRSASGADQREKCKRSMKWVCPSCIRQEAKKLLGSRVAVWWHDDQQFYFGCINAFDEVSECHRVLYEDQQWEFLNLAVEPALLDI